MGAAVALAAVLVNVAPAQAASVAPEKTDAPSCWYDLDSAELQCYADDLARTGAIVAETGKSPVIGTTGRGALQTQGLVSTQAVYIVAQMYQSADYAGNSLVVSTSQSAMCTTYSWTVNTMPSFWNDAVGSFKSYGTCKTRLSEHNNQLGTRYGPGKNAPALGYMDDKTSSYVVDNF